MKKIIQWLAKVFNANITTEKVVTKEVIKEVPKEIIKEIPIEKEVIKEVVKEVPVYVTDSTISSNTKLVDGDIVIDGNLQVKGDLTVSGGVTCLKSIIRKKKGESNE